MEDQIQSDAADCAPGARQDRNRFPSGHERTATISTDANGIVIETVRANAIPETMSG
jgi:hypothetical protein